MIKRTNAKPAIDTAPSDDRRCCTACGSSRLTDIFESERLPVNVGVMCDTEEEAKNAPVADVILAYCHDCGLVFNRIYDLTKVGFEPGYEVALNHSPVFREFISGVADRLLDRFDLRNKTFLEIGCGDGYFLRLLAERGGNHGIGIDPSVPREGRETFEQGSAEYIRDFFGDKHADIATDFICCLSVFEAVPYPAELLSTVRRIVGERTNVPLYFEVFNAFRAIENRETWSILYEQCNYFSLESLASLFRRCGFEVTDANTCYQGDQYIYVEAKGSDRVVSAEKNASADVADEAGELTLPKVIADFAAAYVERSNYWQEQLNAFRRDKQRVVVWGSGGKGIGFLNALNTDGVIDYVVEINPDKQGKYLPGSGQRIVPIEFLAEYKPDKVIITNALYRDEMRQQASELGVTPEFVVA